MHRLLTRALSSLPRALAPIARDQGAVTGLSFALMAIPMVMLSGMAVDFARASVYRTKLQDAVDNAALSGAAAYVTATSGATAQTVATSNINDALAKLSGVITIGTPSVQVGAGTLNSGIASYNVTVTVQATVKTTLLQLLQGTIAVKLTATAGNPVVTPVFSSFSANFSAFDFNTVYAYPVPIVGGKPAYTQLPTAANLYMIADNNSNFPVPANQTFPTITATQPIAFALRNATGGNTGYGTDSCGNPKTNAYGVASGVGSNAGLSGSGQYNWFYSSFLMAGQAPTQASNYTYGILNSSLLNALGIIPFYPFYFIGLICVPPVVTSVTTSYPTNVNCSFLIAQVDPKNPPSTPPVAGTCLGLTDPSSGYQHAAMSCAQMSGKTYGVWWNDMGGIGGDDKDYNDAAFLVTCSLGSGSSVGTGATTTPPLNVLLIK